MDQLGRYRESFSSRRSSFDFNSSFVLNSSSDEDVYAIQQRNKLDDMNHDAFIELDLRPSVQLQATTDNDDDDDKELELRISFSAVHVPFPGFCPSSISSGTNDDIPQDQAPANAHLTPPNYNNFHLVGLHDQSTLISCIHPQLIPTLSNYPTAATFSIIPPPPVDHDDNYAHDCGSINDMINSWKLLVQSRKASSSSAAKIKSSSGTAPSGGIMKFLVKMRCIISSLHMGLGSMGASSLIQRPCSTADQTYNNGRICRINNAFMKMKAFEKWFSWPRNHQLSTMRSSSTKVEIVLDQMKLNTTRRNYLFGSSSCGVMSPLKKTKTGSESRCRAQ